MEDMVPYPRKRRLTKAQEAECARWLYPLTWVWNWAARKIELNAKDTIYFSKRFGKSVASSGHAQLRSMAYT
jgi:hypothetical protein